MYHSRTLLDLLDGSRNTREYVALTSGPPKLDSRRTVNHFYSRLRAFDEICANRYQLQPLASSVRSTGNLFLFVRFL